ncbi:MAG TPA: hypothetical protein VIJ79_15010 [Acidobacteriaceae bacterium]
MNINNPTKMPAIRFCRYATTVMANAKEAIAKIMARAKEAIAKQMPEKIMPGMRQIPTIAVTIMMVTRSN